MNNSIPHGLVQCIFDFSYESVDVSACDETLPNPLEGKKYCPGCDRWLDATSEFWHWKSGRKEFRLPCKQCRHDAHQASPDDARRRAHEYYEAILAKPAEEQKAFRDRQNKQRQERSASERQAGMCAKCLARPASVGHLCDHCYEYTKQWSDQLRDEVFAAYGGKCVVCGEAHPAFLAIDHINDDGADQRRIVGKGHRLYLWLRKQGFPKEGYQLLCHNHNWLKRLQLQPIEKTRMMIWYALLRQEVLVAYGGICVCCGEDRPEVLTVDHVRNDGAVHRRQVGGGGPFYSWLRKQCFPQDGRFALLCFNCNRARYYYDVCPHQQ